MKRTPRLTLTLTLVLACGLSVPAETLAQSGSASIVISQVYGGGGNQGAILTNDFIELFNRGVQGVDVTGWTVQYASAQGGNWDRTSLVGTIFPGQYYLVKEWKGNNGTVPLPSADAEGGLALSASSGKVAIVRSSSLLSGDSPRDPDIVDFVGYGEANFAEGLPAGKLSNTTAAVRKGSGCVDTDSNR